MRKIADFSKYQGNVDWSKAAKELDLAIIRVQYGSTSVDSKYKEYVAGCKKYNIPFGHYAYAKFMSVEDAKIEAKDFLSRADKDAKFLVVDVEEVTVRNKSDLIPATQAFIDYLHTHGVKKVGLYTGHSFYLTYHLNKVKADFLWIPRYPSNDKGLPTGNKPAMKADLWQYTQNGRLLGVNGAIDLNQIIGDKDLNWFIGKTVVKASPTSAKTVKKSTTVKVKTVTKPKPKNPILNRITGSTYKVVSGDTLSSISIRAKISIDNLVKWNNIKNKNNIKVGQILKLKAPAQKYKTYKIVSGDSLSKIANKFKTDVTTLKKLNGLKSDVIYAGKTLKVPNK